MVKNVRMLVKGAVNQQYNVRSKPKGLSSAALNISKGIFIEVEK